MLSIEVTGSCVGTMVEDLDDTASASVIVGLAQCWVLADPGTHPSLLHAGVVAVLDGDITDPGVVRALAANPSIEPVDLVALCRYPDDAVVAAAAANPALPECMLGSLVWHASPVVRSVVASDVRCTPELLDALASSPDEGVCLAVLGNRAVAFSTVMTLLYHGSGRVSGAAAQRADDIVFEELGW